MTKKHKIYLKHLFFYSNFCNGIPPPSTLLLSLRHSSLIYTILRSCRERRTLATLNKEVKNEHAWRALASSPTERSLPEKRAGLAHCFHFLSLTLNTPCNYTLSSIYILFSIYVTLFLV